MKTYNTYYFTQEQFAGYLEKHDITDNTALLVQVFTSSTELDEIQDFLKEITTLLPTAALIGATTDGEICSGKVSIGKTVISLTQFTETQLTTVLIETCQSSFETGRDLATALVKPDTKLIISFTDGLNCNGEAYLAGLSSVAEDIIVAGGLAGDSNKFEVTYVFTKEHISANGAVGVSLQNSELILHTSHSFNWLKIGKKMTITKVKDNRVYSIDDLPAFEVYKKYLGEDIAQKLPSVGIEFPLIIQREDGEIARAVLASHDDGSLSFAGSFSVGDMVYFGYGDAEMILDRSIEAQYDMSETPIESIFIYSCMARRRFMPNLIENEIKPFQELADVAGFFTYGEFYTCPAKKELMNQTMTLIGISESKQVKKVSPRQGQKKAELNEYQKSIKALSHLLNVTTREMAEENRTLEEDTAILRAKKESMLRAQEVGHFGSWEIDLITKKSIWSDESYRIYKLDPETTEPTLDTFLSRVVEADRPKVAEAMKALSDGKVRSLVVHVERTDGVIITVLLNAKMTFDEHGRAIKMLGTTLDITEQVRLKEKNEEFSQIIEHSTNEIYIIEKGTYRYLYVNEQALKTLGYTREEMLEMTMLDINTSMSMENADALQETLIEKGSILNRTMHTKKDGTRYPVQSYVQYRKYDNKDVAIIFDIDITALTAAETKQKEQAQILEQIHDSVISTDLNGIITQWNNGAMILHGYSEDEMVGHSIERLYRDEDLNKLHWIRQQAILHQGFHDQIEKVTKSGEVILADVSVSLLKDNAEKVIGLIHVSQDITHRLKIENKLREQTQLLNFQAYHDALTGLPNRALFDDRLEQAIANAGRHQEHFGLFFIDLDNFKQINDTLGHHYGDEVLKVVAKRLSGCVRLSDTLARLGGDEFTILVQDLDTSESAATIAQKIIEVMKPKIMLEEHELHISASIGISLYPDDSQLKNDLLKYADTAMYKAKDEGRNNYQFYSADMTLMAFEKVMMETSLRKGLENKEFIVYYQPQVDARDNRIVGMEALVRWQHPHMGIVMPDKFIPVAEESGIIKELDHYVMLQAMKDMAEWHESGLNPGSLSLNLSIKQLISDNYVSMLKASMRLNHFDVGWLELEITESQMMLDPMKSISILQTLSDMGIEIAIDDFGTGYSSLAYLKRLPVNKLKIDRSFVQELPYDEEDCAISKAVIALAESLNMKIIAEGVENGAQIEYLLSSGCHCFQGYYYSKAIPKEEMTLFLKNNEIVSLEGDG